MKRGRLPLSINALRGTAALSALLSIHSAQGASPKWLTARDEEARALVAKMTLAEKVGQMTQPDWKALKDRNDVGGLFLGSLLCGGSSDPDSGNTLKDWTGVYEDAQKQALATRLALTLVSATMPAVADPVPAHRGISQPES